MMPETKPIAIPLTVECMVDMIESNREAISKEFHIEPDFEIDLESVQKMIDYANEPILYCDPDRIAYVEHILPRIEQ